MTAVITTYNRRNVVPDAVASALAQTVRDIEVLVVDDGSADGTADDLAERFGHDARLRVVTRPNGGAPAARNTGLDHARGPFVALLDSDDLWDPGYLESQLAVFAAKPWADLVIDDGICEEPDGSVRRLSAYANWVLPDSIDALCRGTWILPSLTVVRTAAARDIRFDVALRRCDDTDFIWRFVDAGYRVAGNPEPLGRYRALPPGQTQAAPQLSLDEDRLLLATYDIWKRYRDRYPQVLDRGFDFHLEYARRLMRGGRQEEAHWHIERMLRERPAHPATVRLAAEAGLRQPAGPPAP
ncbi:glycosyltransferase family 2 protein [Streptomyces marincola]|uniref:glycosyltransferase family 2 protein n=1 Tax=Streptomyces marincola TaxID=2878388 RepID=UPI00131E982D|nr:glycosyltransferase [Streptomyces marincola]